MLSVLMTMISSGSLPLFRVIVPSGINCLSTISPSFNQTISGCGNPIAVQLRVTIPPAIPACVTGCTIMTGTTKREGKIHMYYLITGIYFKSVIMKIK